MDMCQSKSNSYDLLSRNKALSMRPVTLPSTTNMSVAFNKIACIHSQVSHCLHRAMVLCVKYYRLALGATHLIIGFGFLLWGSVAISWPMLVLHPVGQLHPFKSQRKVLFFLAFP